MRENDDRQQWLDAFTRLNSWQRGLPDATAQQLNALCIRYREIKQAHAATLAAAVDSDVICRECAGQCCHNGKYRLNVLDAIVLTKAGTSLTPLFAQKPLCPYGTADGCLFAAGDRPADCIVFICEAIAQGIASETATLLDTLERELRDCISCAATLTGLPAGTPLLLWAADATPST